jgi:hypothetical protein
LLGITAALAVSFGQFYIALTLLIANRIADGLDGAIARATRHTDRGAFFDIALDFLVYATVPLAFAIWSPYTNALPAALLLSSFVANGSAFLAFSVMAERRGMMTTRQGQKTIYYPGWHRGRIRDDRLYGCLLPISKRVSHSRDSFRNLVLDFGSRPSRSRVEVAGGGRLRSGALLRVRESGSGTGQPKKDVRVDGEYRRVSGPA